jgi:hypothetical protein
MKNIFWTVILAVALVSPTAGAARAAKKKLNACGCYGEGNNCTCTRNAKCGCPGECEPKGCEEARQKQLQKEIEAETKKAKEAEAAAERKLNPEAKAEEGDDAASGKQEQDALGSPRRAEIAPEQDGQRRRRQTAPLPATLAECAASHGSGRFRERRRGTGNKRRTGMAEYQGL